MIVAHDDGSVSYSFPIRAGVFAHKVGVKAADGSISWEPYDTLTDAQKAAMAPGYGEITADDVQYSLLRAMLMGQSWMSNAITEVVTAGKYATIADWVKDVGGVEKIEDASPEALRKVYDALASQIVVDGEKVTITLPSPFPATLGVLALPFGTSIVDKEWTADVGGWDGSGDNWMAAYRPELSADPLFDKENGTGPFMLEEWDKTEQRITLKRFDGFWKGPASLERVVIRTVPEWTTRRLQLLSGDADFATTPVEFLDELGKTDGIKVLDSLPKVFGRGLFYFWPLDDVDNPAIGSGQLDGAGIPPDFFGDIDVRKGFNYAQNYDVLLNQVLLGKTVQSRGPSVRGIMGYRDDLPVYTYDLEKAAEHFKKAFGGKLLGCRLHLHRLYPGRQYPSQCGDVCAATGSVAGQSEVQDEDSVAALFGTVGPAQQPRKACRTDDVYGVGTGLFRSGWPAWRCNLLSVAHWSGRRVLRARLPRSDGRAFPALAGQCGLGG